MLSPPNRTYIPAILSVSTSQVIVIFGVFSELTVYIQTDSDIWIHQLPNIVHRWSQHGLATPWMMQCYTFTWNIHSDGRHYHSDARFHYHMAGVVDKGRETAWQTPISSINKTKWRVLQLFDSVASHKSNPSSVPRGTVDSYSTLLYPGSRGRRQQLWRAHPEESYYNTGWLMELWSTQAKVEGIMLKAAWHWGRDCSS